MLLNLIICRQLTTRCQLRTFITKFINYQQFFFITTTHWQDCFWGGDINDKHTSIGSMCKEKLHSYQYIYIKLYQIIIVTWSCPVLKHYSGIPSLSSSLKHLYVLTHFHWVLYDLAPSPFHPLPSQNYQYCNYPKSLLFP